MSHFYLVPLIYISKPILILQGTRGRIAQSLVTGVFTVLFKNLLVIIGFVSGTFGCDCNQSYLSWVSRLNI